MQLDLSFLRPKGASLLGVSIGSASVKAVELSKSRSGAFRLEGYAIEALPDKAVEDGSIVDHEMVSASIKRCWRRSGSAARSIAMGLPGAAVVTKQIILPADMSENDMEAQVESEASQFFPFPIDEMNLDFQVLGPTPGSEEEVDVMVAAARKDAVSDLVACAETAKLKPAVIDVGTYAALEAFDFVRQQFTGSVLDQIFVLCNLGSQAFNVTVMHGDEEVFAREQAIGCQQLTQDIMRAYGMEYDEAEKAKRTGGLPGNYNAELLRPFLDTLALEISRTMQSFFTSTQYNEVNHIVLMGGGALMPGIDEVIAERTQVETVLANPFARMSVSKNIRPQQLLVDAPSLVQACGLALRRFDS